MISVVIPNWNGKEHLSVCLESLRRQTCQDFEVILVDNGSEDRSVEFVEENYPEVGIIRLKKNHGFSVAVNKGIENSKGEYVALLNNDTETDSRWLEEMTKVLDADESVGLCASKVLYYDKRDVINSAGDAMSVTGYARCIGNYEVDTGQYNHVKEVFGASATAAVYRKSMFDDTGLFDEDYFAYYEDVDLSFRARLSGYRCLYVPTAIVYHKGSATAGELSDFVVYYLQRNSLLNIIKDMPCPIVQYYLKKIVRANLGMQYMPVSRRRFWIWIRAKSSAAVCIVKMLRKRRKIHKNRRVSIRYLHDLLERF